MLNKKPKVVEEHKEQSKFGSKLFIADKSVKQDNIDAIFLSKSPIDQQLVSQTQAETQSLISTQNLKTSVPRPSLKFSHKRRQNLTKFLYQTTLATTSITKDKQVDCFYKRGRYLRNNRMLNHIYYLSALLLTLCAVLLSQSQLAAAADALQTQLQKLKVNSDIIPTTSSLQTIKVELHGNLAKPGDPIPAKHFRDLDLDKITWEVSNFEARHALVLLDLDRKPATAVSSNATSSIYNQFTSLNIPGNLIKAGQNVVALDTPVVPCQPSSKHRLLLLAFHQNQNLDISDVAYIGASSGYSPKRENFNIREFARLHKLDLVAANILLAIGDASGVCSGGMSIHSLQTSVSSILIAMVIATTAFGFANRRLYVN